MNEEKDLQEEEIAADEGMEDLTSFVDIADLDELEYTDNQDVFGELGDIADLGEIPDLSLDTLSDTDADIPEMAEEVSDADALELVEEALDANIPEVSEEASEADASEEPEGASEADAAEEPEGALEADAAEEPEGASEADVPEASEEASEEEAAEEPEEALEADVPEASEEASEEEAAEESEGASEADAAEESEGALDTDLEEESEEIKFHTVEPEEEPADLPEEEIPMPETDGEPDADGPILDDAVSDILAGEEGMDDMDLGFADGEEAAPASEEDSGSGTDSMLGGLLDNMDMGGSLSEDEPLGSMDGLDGLSADTEDMMDVAEMVPEAQQTEKEPGLLKRVFGNVITDEIAEEERLAAQKEEEEAEKKKEEEAKAKEEAEAKKAEKEAEKAAKKEEKKKLKEAKKAEKAAAKEEKRKQKEEQKAAEAAELEVIGKLNKVGVSIIAAATVIFLTAEIAGTNVFGYNNTKNKAMDYFDMGKYTQAYKEAVGTKMAQKDEEEYNKIKVVMKVQQSLNAYQSYDRVNYYPEALDALLRGLKHYDANIDKAIELEVDSDMMSCRKQILTLLQSEFNLSESDAYSILGLDSESYQKKVVKLGLKKR